MHLNKEQLSLKLRQFRMRPGDGLHRTPPCLVAQLRRELPSAIRPGLTQQFNVHLGGIGVRVVHAAIIRSLAIILVRFDDLE